MKKIITTLFLAACGSAAFAQQDAQFSQNMFNKLAVNPGYAGSNGTLCGTLLGRNQWMGFDGAPKTYLISVESPVKMLHGGVGGTIISDQLGFDKTLNVKLDYAYRMPLGPGNVGLGIEAGIIHKSIGGAWKAPDGSDGLTDAAIPKNESALTPDFAVGAYYSMSQMYVGISADHLTAAQIKSVDFKLARHYYVQAGYNYAMSADMELRPSIFVKSDAASTQLDINCNVLFKNTLWAGASYRLKDAIVPMVGFQKTMTSGSSFRVGYAYDLTTSSLRKYVSPGTHELMLSYCLKVPDKPKINKRKTVRFL
jgi:type IX secretion system PorP/SprF family membrane protein